MSVLGNNLFAAYYAQQGLPYGYRKVEYLESSGAQWIDTGVLLTGYDEITADILFPQAQAQRGIWGCYMRPKFRHELIFIPSGLMEPGYGDTNSFTRLSCPIGERLLLEQKNSGFYINGVNKWTCSFSDFSQNLPAFLFHFNMTNNTYSPCIAKVWLFKIIRSGSLYRNFIPCVRLSDSKPGLYDLCGSVCPLTNTPFYVNAGTGEFVIPT